MKKCREKEKEKEKDRLIQGDIPCTIQYIQCSILGTMFKHWSSGSIA